MADLQAIIAPFSLRTTPDLMMILKETTLLTQTSVQRNRTRGFTLIELLVVIAIIAILAAILFPVFAQAREKARATSCLSNEKQIGTATMMYMQDNDGTYPIISYTPGLPSKPVLCTWLWEIQPYAKNWRIFRCPSAVRNPFNAWDGATLSAASNDIDGNNGAGWWEWMGSYGMNKDYLNPQPNCSNATPEGNWFGAPATENQVEYPANTIFATETKPTPVGADEGNYYLAMHYVESPAIYTVPIACGSYGWGDGNAYDATKGEPISFTGQTSVRHNGGSNVVFCDGHVKFLTAGKIAAGTNWKVGINQGDIVVTDISQYLWSLKKSGPDDM